MPDDTPTDQPPKEPQGPFTIDFIGQAWEWRMMHGLRTEDFQRYRQFCTRRLRRLYKSLKFLHGGSKKYQKKQITSETATDGRYVLVLFLQAERVWAYAEAIKGDNSEGDLRKAHHQTSKLAKAVKYSNELLDLCEATCDEQTQIQATAYYNEMCGHNAFGRQGWETALDYYTSARDFWRQLAPTATKEKEIVSSRITDLEQKRRFCWHKCGKDPTKFKGVVDLEGSGGQISLTWMGHTLQITSDKLRDLVERSRNQVEEVETAKQKHAASETSGSSTLLNAALEAYDKLFITFNDANATAKQSLKDESSDSESILRIMNYLQFQLLNHTLERNQFMASVYSAKYLAQGEVGRGVGRGQGPADISRLYELIEQNITEIVSIPGVEDDAMGPKFDNLSLLTRAFKMYWKGEGFRLVKQYEESLACFKYTEQLISEAATHARKHGLSTDECSRLMEMGRQSRCIVYAAAYAEQQEEEQATSERTTKHLVDNLDNYDIDKNSQFMPLPMSLLHMPVKPTFYDIASEYIDYPDLSRYQARKDKKGQAAAKQQDRQQTEQQPPDNAQQQDTGADGDKPAQKSWLQRWVWSS